jgi:preprotein translocase subunit SecG
MLWVIVFLTFFLVVNCLFLMLLVLIQLPKKEAGIGTAFGGSATDALFGAGSGNALTKMTKYTTAIFFVLTLMLSILNAQQSKSRRTQFATSLQRVGAQTETPATTTNAPLIVPPAASTNAPKSDATNAAPATNAPPASATNPPGAAAPAAPSTEKPN